MNQKWNCKI